MGDLPVLLKAGWRTKLFLLVVGGELRPFFSSVCSAPSFEKAKEIVRTSCSYPEKKESFLFAD